MDIVQGWTLTVLGLFVAFTAMSVFVGVIVILKRLFPYRAETVEVEEVTAAVEATPTISASSIEAEVAAIAVAMVAARKQHAPIGQALQAGRGAWWAAGQVGSRQGTSLRKTR